MRFSLARSIDPARADELARRLHTRLPEAEALEHVVALATAYPALESWIMASPEAARAAADDAPGAARDRAGLLARLDAAAAAHPYDRHDLGRVLRSAGRAERARIALRELLPPAEGGCDVDVTGRELTALAEATVELALREAVMRTIERLGPPRSASREGRFVVLGMGKLGGHELNPGSDIDLVFVYDTDEGEAVAPDGRSTSLHDFWARVARRLTATLDDVTELGRVWRVDLRLRPEGQSGPLCNSVAAMERYYESFGRLWERAALLRARPIAGNLELGEAVLASLAPFVWRRHVDPTLAVEMRHLTERARAELGPRAARDLKLGPGGIREAEFFVQSLQLVWGGSEPRLRTTNTLDALQRLRTTGLSTDREAREVSEGYLALRRVEHAVQTASGTQTHALPEGEALSRMARALGFADAGALATDLAARRERISARFASLSPGAEPPSRWTAAVAALERGQREAFVLAIARAAPWTSGEESAEQGATAPVEPSPSEVAEQLLELARHPDSLLGARTREAFPALSETLLDAVLDAADPEQAARALRAFFSRLGHPGVYARLLAGEPRALRRLVEALGASAFVAHAVATNPELGDHVLFSRGGPTPVTARAEVRAALSAERSFAAAGEQDDDEELVGRLRAAKARVTIEVALADQAGEMDTRAAMEVLSELADAQLEAALRRALDLSQEPSVPVRGLAVIAMGKLGGREIGYGSDLDVIFVYDPTAAPEGSDAAEHFARRARRMMRLLTATHPAGAGYELDTRLRPSGSQGMLVTSIDAFARYHAQRHGEGVPPATESAASGERSPASRPSVQAASWERLALLRARPAAGDAQLCERAMQVAHRAAYDSVQDPGMVVAEVHRLRLRMEREASQERPGRYDIKFGRGGLLDIELGVQLLQMRFGREPSVRTTDTLEAIAALAAAGHLGREHAETLRDGYRFLRRLEQRIRVVHGDSAHLLEQAAPGITPLARRMGIRDRPGREAAAALIAHYREVTERVREAYEAIVLVG